jgi:hypothetical protein
MIICTELMTICTECDAINENDHFDVRSLFWIFDYCGTIFWIVCNVWFCCYLINEIFLVDYKL